MTTFTAITTLANEAGAKSLGNMLETLDPAGVGVFEIEDGSGHWEVAGYFTAPPDPAGLALLETLHPSTGFLVSRLPETDWVAEVQRGLTPVSAGRFWVHGRHDAADLPVNAIGLRIEAAMAFGTGHHGTTRGCLLALEYLHRRGLRASRVMDLGCGTGVLAMAAARLWRAQGMAGDIDPVAARTARHNLRANGAAGLIGSATAPGVRHPRLRGAMPAGLVFGNILAAPLKRLAPQIATATAPGGFAVLSGLLHRQVPGVLAVYHGYGFREMTRVREGEWSTLLLRRFHKGCT